MQSIEITAEDVDPPDSESALSHIVQATLHRLGVEAYELSVLYCSPGRMADFNTTYRGVEGETDVLTFSQEEGEEVPSGGESVLRGDIVICPNVVSLNAESYAVDPREESCRVLVHGVMHLCGHEHGTTKLGEPAALENPMLALQEEIVSNLMKELKS